MPGPLHFAPLGSADAALIGALQRQLFSAELTESDAHIADILRNTEQHQICNMSYGLFEGTLLVGYVFAYIETESLFHQRPEDVIYIKEIALLPGYESQMRTLFTRLYLQWLTFAPSLAFEAHALGPALEKWRRLERMFRFYGLTLSAREQAPRPGVPPYRLMRLDAAPGMLELLDRATPLPTERLELGQGLSSCVVTSPRQWLGIAARWEQLRAASPTATPQQCFAELWDWWKCHGTWSELRLVILLRGEELVGIAPLMLQHVNIDGQVLRRLRLLGAPVSVQRGAFLLSAESGACIPGLVAALDASREEWDLIDLAGETDASLVQGLGAGLKQRGYLVARSRQQVLFVEPATGGVAALPGSIAAPGIRRVEDWPQLEEALDQHCEVEKEGGHPGEGPRLGDDRAGLLFFETLARSGGPACRFVQHVAEQGDDLLASRFGVLREGLFRVLRAAHVGGVAAVEAARALEQTERDHVSALGARRIEYATLARPLRDGSPLALSRLEAAHPRYAGLFRGQVRRRRLAAFIDAISIGGIGRGVARRLRSA